MGGPNSTKMLPFQVATVPRHGWTLMLYKDACINSNLASPARIGPLPRAIVRANAHERPAVEALIPLPLSTRRQRQRGYNQCTWICHGLAEVWDLPVWTQVLTKAHRPPQAQQNKAQRAVAMEGAFTVGSPTPEGLPSPTLGRHVDDGGNPQRRRMGPARPRRCCEVHARAIASE